MGSADRIERRQLLVRGQVQGVGFRPFVYQLAQTLSLAGWVRNDGQGVEIEIEGSSAALDQFVGRVRADLPPLARIDELESSRRQPAGADGFRIVTSRSDSAITTGIAPDSAVCGACLVELFDPADRRYRYPFINCTHCGPRYTITRALPYDRHHTSMRDFEMCAPCQREYDAPDSRRFHAQPNACPTCGPRLQLLGAAERLQAPSDAISEVVSLLGRGRIVAIKGLGGFHLACDARNGEAVARLRARKAREEKPLAVMLSGAASLESLVEIDRSAAALLSAREAPIVLLRKRAGCDAALPGVAPGIAWLGALLPYTPLHYLLFHQAAGRPVGCDWLATPQPLALVMTSANPGGEPLVSGNDEAVGRLDQLADAILLHDRDILLRCDDSLARSGSAGPAFIRRGRGYTPQPIRLPRAGPSVLACGGWYKNSICLTRGDQAFLSQHVGDLDNAPTCRALEELARHLMQVLAVEPVCVAHDLHPDFFSTRFAQDYAHEHALPAVAAQHHHAHAAAVAAEHDVTTPHLALTLDGVGLGVDNQPWGGELLRVDGARFERLGHLRPLALPGGDRAAREPWRMAASALHALGRADEIATRFRHPAAATVRQQLDRGLNAPLTSSAGRLFDAAAGLLGVGDVSSYEAQAAMLLEGLAESFGPSAATAQGFTIDQAGNLDLLPSLAQLVDESNPARGAASFHATLALALASWVQRASRTTGLRTVVLGGGCLLNFVLSTALRSNLVDAGLRVLQAGQAPPNDGGLSLGQAWIAIQSLERATGVS